MATENGLGSESRDKAELLAKPVFCVEGGPVSAPEASSHNLNEPEEGFDPG
jgi:hypothetical protein